VREDRWNVDGEGSGQGVKGEWWDDLDLTGVLRFPSTLLVSGTRRAAFGACGSLEERWQGRTST